MSGMRRRGHGVMEAVDNAHTGADSKFNGATTTQTGVGLEEAHRRAAARPKVKTATVGEAIDMVKRNAVALKRRVLGD